MGCCSSSPPLRGSSEIGGGASVIPVSLTRGRPGEHILQPESTGFGSKFNLSMTGLSLGGLANDLMIRTFSFSREARSCEIIGKYFLKNLRFRRETLFDPSIFDKVLVVFSYLQHSSRPLPTPGI